MKKRFWITLCLLLALTGCRAEEAAAPELVPATPQPLPESAPEIFAAENTLRGTVYNSTAESVVVQTGDGSLYAFGCSEEVCAAPEDVAVGYDITLRFRGELDEGVLWQTADLLALELAPPETAGEEAAEAVTELVGTVYDAAMYTLTVQDAQGRLYTFPKDPEKCHAPDGILLGYEATVRCSGQPDAAELWQTVPVLSITVTPGDVPAMVNADAGIPAAVEQAEALLARMTLREKVGQIFLLPCPTRDAAEVTSRIQPGGYVLYSGNAAGRTPAVLKGELETIQAAAGLPVLIAVDEEGGSVNRLSSYGAFRAAPFAAPMELYRRGGWTAISADTAEKCSLLRSLGIHVNLAPVCDVCSDPASYMYSRSFGGDAALTARYVTEAVQGYTAGGVGCVLKHFPGYGDNVDTHTTRARDERSLDELENRDLLPFRSGIEAGAGAVLLSHTVVCALDSERPASLSPAVCGYLRETLGFEGVIMTDDLSMSAVRSCGGSRSVAVQALEAGCDMLCCGDYEREVAAVLAAVESGEVSRERLDEAVLRVLRWKLSLGLMN